MAEQAILQNCLFKTVKLYHNHNYKGIINENKTDIISEVMN